MARRLPSAPPALPGFTPVRVLGSGGFADVFLFEQNLPRRFVAVKVVVPEVVDDQVRRMFRSEADLMAGLSAHPSVLTVYEAGVSSDGRPYLVTELCSSSLGDGYRSRPLPVADVLRIGVRVGGALHAAHYQGVLHRDVKPSNILITAFGAPVLGDFGVASTMKGRAGGTGAGLSIPWSAPEVVDESTPGTVASEVWSLGATLYSLLAGRSPFERPGSAPGELARRVRSARLPALGRDDVPASLERVLSRSMAKDPARRQADVAQLVHELQAVEAELGLTPTPAELAPAAWAGEYARDPDDRTRIAPATSSAQGGGGAGAGRSGSTTRRRTVTVLVAGAAALAVVAVAGLAGLTLGRQSSSTAPAVGEIRTVESGEGVRFEWADPGLAAGDSYRVTTSTGGTSVQQSAEFVVHPAPGQRICITVAVVRAGRAGEPSSPGCTEGS
ncbi:serine/threonine protein kinase [Herbiconiux moechotypicola]|uniref:non-specific serine/threonine protein kinase n=1 Tax=Herbiconiux moechotypicola TaxID=637393 RepID=A0ABN3D834_9MICO|nr:serine/threonine-protein kinase [Herbiconiux moechotypicola]MCS5728315.1 serine/threonine protein kinase [Herbiconiux moechotypicola]